ncbi:hypothetical protein [Streptomyces sp. NPDC047315]|uniref:hypothetical protein n=1 Tax=Streptomyces sp. NPDC047315 TaxID=3155142 RepID=UPI0034068169
MHQQKYVNKRGANHTLHLVLSIFTCGLWAITGWPIAAAMGRKTVTTVPVASPPHQQAPGYPQHPHPGYGLPQQQPGWGQQPGGEGPAPRQ